VVKVELELEVEVEIEVVKVEKIAGDGGGDTEEVVVVGRFPLEPGFVRYLKSLRKLASAAG